VAPYKVDIVLFIYYNYDMVCAKHSAS